AQPHDAGHGLACELTDVDLGEPARLPGGKVAAAPRAVGDPGAGKHRARRAHGVLGGCLWKSLTTSMARSARAAPLNTGSGRKSSGCRLGARRHMGPGIDAAKTSILDSGLPAREWRFRLGPAMLRALRSVHSNPFTTTRKGDSREETFLRNGFDRSRRERVGFDGHDDGSPAHEGA